MSDQTEPWGFSRRKRAAEVAWAEWAVASQRTGEKMTVEFEAGFHMGVGAVQKDAAYEFVMSVDAEIEEGLR